MKTLILSLIASTTLWQCGLAMAAGPNLFYAMDTGTSDAAHPTPESQSAMLKELGYAGMGYTVSDGVPQMLAALDAQGLRMFSLYVNVMIDAEEPHYPESLPAAIKTLQGRGTVIWLAVQSKKYMPSSPEGDAEAVPVLREIADMAAASGLPVALYPHARSWVENLDDAMRMVEKVDRPNVGVTFNLCHWLKVGDRLDLKSRLQAVMPHLTLVTINGADKGDDWKQLIQTLDRGSYDVYGLLKTLRELGYANPIALQGFGIGGDAHDNLRRSMEAWQKYSARLAEER